jgi:thermostable 8-oxoguanine DNA glycosylase
MQRVAAHRLGELTELSLPSPRLRVSGHDMFWGRIEEVGSPAYWAAQAWMWEIEEPEHFRLGRTLREEVLACLLGGYGIPAEVGLAAYARLRTVSVSDLGDEEQVLALLSEPLPVRGRTVRYRFARQKARHVAGAITGLARIADDEPDRSLRDALTSLPGIGLKTASWIVRNWRGSDEVSILDVHIVRACRTLGIFASTWRVERHYEAMEDAYLRFARAIGARASILDSVIWMTMRSLPASIVTDLVKMQPSIAQPQRSAGFDTGQMALL